MTSLAVKENPLAGMNNPMRANGAAGREDASVKQLRRDIASLSSRFTERFTQQEELIARQQAEIARQQAEMARQQAEMARQQAEMAQLKSIVESLTTFSTPQATTAATTPAAAEVLCRALDAGEAAVVAQEKDRKSSLIEVHKSDAHGGAEYYSHKLTKKTSWRKADLL